MHLDLQIGEQAINYPEVAAREKLGELQLRIRQLLDQIEQITKEQVYQRVRRNNVYTFTPNESCGVRMCNSTSIIPSMYVRGSSGTTGLRYLWMVVVFAVGI